MEEGNCLHMSILVYGLSLFEKFAFRHCVLQKYCGRMRKIDPFCCFLHMICSAWHKGHFHFRLFIYHLVILYLLKIIGQEKWRDNTCLLASWATIVVLETTFFLHLIGEHHMTNHNMPDVKIVHPWIKMVDQPQ